MIAIIIFIFGFFTSILLYLLTYQTPYLDGLIAVGFIVASIYLVFEKIEMPPDKVVTTNAKVHNYLKTRFTYFGRSMLISIIIATLIFSILISIDRFRLGLSALISWGVMFGGYLFSLHRFGKNFNKEVAADYIAIALNKESRYIYDILIKLINNPNKKLTSEEKEIYSLYNEYTKINKNKLTGEEIREIKKRIK